MEGIKTPSGNVDVFISELEAEVLDLTPEKEARDLEMPAGFPLVLNAGRHMTTNINTMMRNPQWNEGKRACTVAVSPADAADLDLVDGQDVKVTTAAGSAVGELEISEQVRDGMVLVPHGFGLNYDGTVYGINVNQLTRSSHRDPIGTPLHRFVPCRVEGVGG
jgi:anaerobic selenocysteine-containing dehydrogenase